MTTHFGNQIPKYEDQEKWFFYNAYQAYCDGYPPVILPDLVKKIHDKGFTRIYLSMGSKYAKGQETVQKLKDFEDQMAVLNQLEGIVFDAVVIDSLNPPHANIKKLFPCRSEECYLKGEDPNVFGKEFDQSWTEDGPKAVNPWKLEKTHPSRVIFDELAQGPNSSHSNFKTMCRNCWNKLAGKPLECYVLRPARSPVAL